jgi:NADH-quinone oxidoreductase subunit L
MFVGIGIGTSLGATYQLISQGLFKALAFLAAGSVLTATGTKNVEELGGLRKTMKYTYTGFLFAALAMSGVPPLVGFWSKDWITSSALTANTVAAILIILSTVLTTLYSFRALFKVFHGSPKKLPKEAKESPGVMIAPILTLVIALVFGWLVLNYQSLLPFYSGISEINPLTIGLSLAAIGAGAGIAYVAFDSRVAQTQELINSSVPLVNLRSYLLEGFGFDRFYRFIYTNALLPFARITSYLESGLLGINIALMLGSVLVIILLVALRVI